MRKAQFWIYFVLILNCLEAVEEIPLTRLIEAYYEAEDYDEAIELLKKLQAEKLPAWQKARIMYNIGTILMYKGLWEEASRVFSSIPLSLHSIPILRPAINNNLAILNYMKAKQLMSKKELTLNCDNQTGKAESPSSSTQATEGGTTQDILRLLLLMDQDDRNPQPEPVEIRKGAKPW
ncbi:MAG TPA: hypothetical protein VIH61_07490 [Waddliaceae bacterium]